MVCAECQKYVSKNHRKLMCTVCKNFVHKKCSNMTTKEFKRKESHQYWYCTLCCNNFELPFNHINDENEFCLQLYRFFENKSILESSIKAKCDNLSLDPTLFQTDLDDGNTNNYTEYFNECELKELHKSSKHNFSILNLNIRSLNNKIDDFKDFLNCTGVNFGIIGLVETWLKEKPVDYFLLDGYTMEHKNRNGKGGGGVCLYIKNDIKYKVRDDLAKINHPANVESLFIEIERPKSKNIVVGVLYRPPDQDLKEFNDFFDEMLTKATKNQKCIYMMGDFNIN